MITGYAYKVDRLRECAPVPCPLCGSLVALDVFMESWTPVVTPTETYVDDGVEDVPKVRISVPEVHACAGWIP